MDGQDNSLDDSDCSATVADEGVPPTASSAPLQPPPTQTPPTNGAEVKSPVGVIEVKVKAAAEVKQAPAVCTPERHYRPLERAREKRRLRLEESQRSRRPRLECVGKGTVCQQMRTVQPRIHRLRLVTI